MSFQSSQIQLSPFLLKDHLLPIFKEFVKEVENKNFKDQGIFDQNYIAQSSYLKIEIKNIFSRIFHILERNTISEGDKAFLLRKGLKSSLSKLNRIWWYLSFFVDISEYILMEKILNGLDTWGVQPGQLESALAQRVKQGFIDNIGILQSSEKSRRVETIGLDKKFLADQISFSDEKSSSEVVVSISEVVFQSDLKTDLPDSKIKFQTQEEEIAKLKKALSRALTIIESQAQEIRLLEDLSKNTELNQQVETELKDESGPTVGLHT